MVSADKVPFWFAGIRRCGSKRGRAANSSYFGSKPFRLVLPNLGGLYEHIETYIAQHRHGKRLEGGPLVDFDRATVAVSGAKLMTGSRHL